MPRKEWIPKNPYCRRSKLNKFEFEFLVYCYFLEVTGGLSRNFLSEVLMTREGWVNDNLFSKLPKPKNPNYNPEKSFEANIQHMVRKSHHGTSRDDIRRFVHLYFKRFGHKPPPLSRQAISRYFDKIGQYIWDRFIVNWEPSFREENVFDDLIGLIYKSIKQISTPYREFYNSLDKYPLHINEEKITGSLMFNFLENRSKTTRGFKKNKFYLEFSRVFLICAVICECKHIKLESIYSAIGIDAKLNFATWVRTSQITRNSKIYLLHFLKEKPM